MIPEGLMALFWGFAFGMWINVLGWDYLERNKIVFSAYNEKKVIK